MKILKNIKFILLIFCLVYFSHVHPGRAIVVRQINLAEMVRSSKYIFSGTCTDAEKIFDEDLQQDIYVFTFRIKQMVKGPQKETISVRVNRMLIDMKQVPGYQKGEEVVLFLYPESKSGFTTTVGIGQGKFSLRNLETGTRQVLNQNNNRNLFKGIPAARLKGLSAQCHEKADGLFVHGKGPLDYDFFINILKTLIQSK